jgi:peptidyl-prolyl cis-trans isomerase C
VKFLNISLALLICLVAACKKPSSETKPTPSPATNAAAPTTAATPPTPGEPPAPGAPAASAGDPVIATVNGESIHFSDFSAAVSTLPMDYRRAAGTPEGKKTILDELIKTRILRAEGKRLGVDKDPGVEKQIAIMSDKVVADAALQKIVLGGPAPDLKKEYNANKSAFASAHVRQILVAFQGGRVPPKSGQPLPLSEAKAKADSIVAKLRGGADFATVAKSDSDDQNSAQYGGDLGPLQHGQAPPELEKVIFGLSVKSISEPLKTELGFHIFQVTEKSFAPFEAVKPQLTQQVLTNKAKQTVDKLRAKAKVTIDPAFIGPQGK